MYLWVNLATMLSHVASEQDLFYDELIICYLINQDTLITEQLKLDSLIHTTRAFHLLAQQLLDQSLALDRNSYEELLHRFSDASYALYQRLIKPFCRYAKRIGAHRADW